MADGTSPTTKSSAVLIRLGGSGFKLRATSYELIAAFSNPMFGASATFMNRDSESVVALAPNIGLAGEDARTTQNWWS